MLCPACASFWPRACLQDTETAYIMLTSEEDGSHLVKAKVHMEGAYQRQQGACQLFVSAHARKAAARSTVSHRSPPAAQVALRVSRTEWL